MASFFLNVVRNGEYHELAYFTTPLMKKGVIIMRDVLKLNARTKLEAIDALTKAAMFLERDVDYTDTDIEITVSVPENSMKIIININDKD